MISKEIILQKQTELGTVTTPLTDFIEEVIRFSHGDDPRVDATVSIIDKNAFKYLQSGSPDIQDYCVFANRVAVALADEDLPKEAAQSSRFAFEEEDPYADLRVSYAGNFILYADKHVDSLGIKIPPQDRIWLRAISPSLLEARNCVKFFHDREAHFQGYLSHLEAISADGKIDWTRFVWRDGAGKRFNVYNERVEKATRLLRSIALATSSPQTPEAGQA